MSSALAIFKRFSSDGCLALVHHCEIVDSSFPICSANHLFFLLVSARATFILLISTFANFFVFYANILTYLEYYLLCVSILVWIS